MIYAQGTVLYRDPDIRCTVLDYDMKTGTYCLYWIKSGATAYWGAYTVNTYLKPLPPQPTIFEDNEELFLL